MIPFNNRFHGHSSLRYVYKNCKAIHSHSLTIKTAVNSHRKQSRAAVIISRKILKSAVRRNRIRRQLYEYIQAQLPSLNGVYYIVIIVLSAELFSASHDDISKQMAQLFTKSGIQKVN